MTTQMNLPMAKEKFVPVMSCREALQNLVDAVMRRGLAEGEEEEGEAALNVFAALDIARVALDRPEVAR